MVIAGAATLLVASGGALALASAANNVHRASDATTQRINGHSSGPPCRTGYDTQTTTLVPPDDTTTDNPAASTVQFKKTCAGMATASFSSEASTPGAADFIHIDMRATCVGPGGLSHGCTPGQMVWASPGHTFFQTGPTAFGVKSINMVWSALPKGVWKFEVLPGGNNVASLQFRSLIVSAYEGG